MLTDDLSTWYLQEALSDVHFRLDEGPLVPAHKVVCAARSDVMRAMFLGPFQEGTVAEVGMPGIHRGAFLELLRFMYMDKMELSPENVVHACALADEYMVPEMISQSTLVMQTVIRCNADFWVVLSSAVGLNCEVALRVSAEFLLNHASDLMGETPGSQLTAPALSWLLGKILNVDELDIFKFCLCWADAVSSDRREALRGVVPFIRFPLLSYQDLATVVAESGVLSEAEQLAVFKHKSTGGGLSSGFLGEARIQAFRYQSDFDTNGLVYWLGACKTGEFRNPHQGRQAVVSSSSHVSYGDLSNIVSRGPPIYTRLDSFESSWFAIDFVALGSARLNVDKYSLRHGRDSAKFSLRSWVLEGSSDGSEWKVLAQHENDSSLNGSFAVASWDVTTDEWVRAVRVRMTGRDSQGQYFLHLAGVEVYGTLRR